MAHRLTADDVAQIYDVAPPRPPLVSIPAPLNRTRAELRAARIAALRAQIREVESWPVERYEVTAAGREALMVQLEDAAKADATGNPS